MAQVTIYVGAIAVLVLFAVLLTPRASRDNSETVWALPGMLLAVCLAAIFLFVVHDTQWKTMTDAPLLTTQDLGRSLLGTWVLPFEIASGLLTAGPAGRLNH